MELENILSKEELEKIKRIAEMSVELKHMTYEELTLEAQRKLRILVDEDADELIRDIIGDAFVVYMDEKTKTGEDKK